MENTHAFLEWCKEKEVGIVFVGEAWIEKNSREIQTHLSFVLISTGKNARKVMTYVRKGMEEEVNIVKKVDEHIILQEKNKKKIGEVYANGMRHGKKWKV